MGFKITTWKNDKSVWVWNSHSTKNFNKYEDVHCFHSAGLHDYLKFIKLGYSKVTDHACREIRLKRMTRDQGIKMVSKYSNVYPSDINLFLDWIEMDKTKFLIFDNRSDLSIWDNQKMVDGFLKIQYWIKKIILILILQG